MKKAGGEGLQKTDDNNNKKATEYIGSLCERKYSGFRNKDNCNPYKPHQFVTQAILTFH